MKKLIFCFDGTWNDIKVGGVGISNVAKIAAMLANLDHDGNPQIIHYDTGVGTGRTGKISEGALGKGLAENLKEAYVFLCMNYVPGDEISIFGFSRGAFTARSFAGLISHCGIMQRAKIEKAVEATELYKLRSKVKPEEKTDLEDMLSSLKFYCGAPINTSESDEASKCLRSTYEQGSHELLKIKYLGVWDTVGTLIDLDRSDVDFHDIDIPYCVEAGRHAVAIDEYRPHFDIDLWENLEEANKRAYDRHTHSDAVHFPDSLQSYRTWNGRAFQEVWFPGEHGSVGGGGDVLGLSDEALHWVLEGAVEHAGLRIDSTDVSKAFGLRPTPLAPLDNSIRDTFKENAMEWMFGRPLRSRKQGPKGLHQISRSAQIRYLAPPAALPEGQEYRPRVLEKFKDDIKAAWNDLNASDYIDLYNGYDTHGAEAKTVTPSKDHNGQELILRTVQEGETLAKIAEEYPGHDYKSLQKINKVMVPDPNKIYRGQIINVPAD